MTIVPKDRARTRRSDVPGGSAALFALLLVLLGAPSAGLAQTPNVGATLDDNVPAGTYKQNGDTLNYKTVITNSGGADATGVQATTPTPADTTFVAGSVHASPLAINDTYNAVGNTKLYVGVSVPAGEPALAISGGLFVNDTTITDSNVFVSNTSPSHGAVSVNTNGTFVYTPNAGYTGADSFTYTIKNSTDATLTDTGTVSISVGTLVWYVNNSAGAGGDGRSTTPFNSLAGVNGAGGSGDSDTTNSVIYVYKGSGAYGGGLPLENGQVLTSESNALVVDSNTLRAAVPANVPTLSHNAATTVVLANGNPRRLHRHQLRRQRHRRRRHDGDRRHAVTVTGGTAAALTSGTLTVTGTTNAQ